jgi:hypothetical protein
MSYAITIFPYNGSNVRLTWTFPDDIGNHLPDRRAFLYLQRSVTAKSYWPLQPNTKATSVVSNVPTPESGWTTIQSWTIATAAQLAAAATYTDSANMPPAPTYSYRLIVYQETSGSDFKEWDWLPVNTGPGASLPGSVSWARGFGSVSTDYARAVCSDTSGNIYTTGVFSGTVDFGGTSLTATGLQDVFVTKHTPAGALTFVKHFGVAGQSFISFAICLDPSGNIFISGTLPSGSLIKLNTSGIQQWVKGPVAIALQSVSFLSISAGSDGSVVATGIFVAQYNNTMEFGDSHPLDSVSGSQDAFLAKYDTSGTCLWAQNFLNWGDAEFSTAVVVDRAHSDNIFMAGYTLSGISIGGVVLSNNGPGASGFLAKLDASGTLISTLARNVGVNGGQTGGCRLNCMTLDPSGNIIVSGPFTGHCNFGGGDRVSNAPQLSAWFAKYNGTTLAWIWDLQVTTQLQSSPNSLCVDAVGNIYATGSFTKTATFGTKSITSYVQPAGNEATDIFVCKMTPAGAFAWAMQAGGTDVDNGLGITFAGTSGPVAVGSFYNNVNGTPAQFGARTLTSQGGLDACIFLLSA